MVSTTSSHSPFRTALVPKTLLLARPCQSALLISHLDALAMANSRKRPRSRGSTTSIHSATTQPKLEENFAESQDVYAAQWLANGISDSIPSGHGQHRELAPASHHQMTPEDLLLASQLQASREFMEAPAMANSMHGAGFSQSHNASRQSMSAESFAGNTSFAEDSQMLDRDGNEDNESFSGLQPNAKPASRTSANNEQEMRQLFVSNKHRNLQEVAQELHGNERGPNSERTRQVFAMLWYDGQNSCRFINLPRRLCN